MRRCTLLFFCFPLAFLALAQASSPRLLTSSPQSAADTQPDASQLVIIGSLTNHYGPVLFDHDLHVAMSSIGDDCRTCHHQTDADAPITGCAECHAASGDEATFSRPSLKGAYHRQCLGCHREWSHANGCVSCHQEATGSPTDHTPPDLTDTIDAPHADVVASGTYVYMTSRQPLPIVTFHHDDHARVFGLRCADCHRGASCGACHGPEASPSAVDREQTCYSCHASQNCVKCHGPDQRPAFSHADVTGWSLEPSHHGVPCTDCHGAERSFGAPQAARCDSCHRCPEMTPEAHAGADVPLAGSHGHFECVVCHKGGSAASIATCTDCHAGMNYPADMPGVRRVEPAPAPRCPVVTDEWLARL